MPWQPGQSGNPKGRGTRDKFITQQIIAELKANDGEKLRKVVIALIDQAMAGDISALREVTDRAEGKAPQAIEHAGTVEIEHSGATELLTRGIAGVAARLRAAQTSQVTH